MVLWDTAIRIGMYDETMFMYERICCLHMYGLCLTHHGLQEPGARARLWLHYTGPATV